MKSHFIFFEIGQTSLTAWHEGRAGEWTVEREENGRLTEPCRERLAADVRGFVRAGGWRPGLRVWCAIGARGVSMRRISLPSSTKDEIQRLVPLQIESEFPLPPDQLAWGYARLGPVASPPREPSTREELLVVVVKKEVIEDYAELFTAAGLKPEFTLAALARSALRAPGASNCGVLDIGGGQSEFAVFENGAPVSIRVLPWGGSISGRAAADKSGAACEETAIDALARAIRGGWAGQKLYLSGKPSTASEIRARLAQALEGTTVELLQPAAGERGSAAVLGLKKLVEEDQATALLTLKTNLGAASEKRKRPVPLSWAVLAGSLLVCTLLLPSAEALVGRPRLAARLSALKADRSRLPAIDQELGLLRFLQENQPPYLEVLALLGGSAPPGIRLEAVSMSRHGDLILRGKLAMPQQVVEFRSKLIDSGYFSTVVVEEQSPSPDRMIAMRISAKWKSAAERASLTVASRGPDPGKGKEPGRAGPAGPPATEHK